MLNILEFVKKSNSSQLEWELIVITFNKLLNAGIHENWEKVENYANESGEMKTKIK